MARLTIAETKLRPGPIGRHRPTAEAWRRLPRNKLGEIENQIAQLKKIKNVLAMLT